MLKFFFNAAPNPMKITLLLEELGLPFEAVPVDTRKGEQFAPAFLAVNPNAKVPAITDGDVTVFDSNAILLYLADREQKFVPAMAQAKERGAALSWLLFIASGIGPFSGQSVHFRHAAPEPKDYALNRYDFEAHRHWSVLEKHLAQNTYMLGEHYSIVDMALWGWARMCWAQGKPPGRITPTSNACWIWSTPARRPSAPKPSKRNTPSRPKWTRMPRSSCSRKTNG
jgi:GST-like protein